MPGISLDKADTAVARGISKLSDMLEKIAGDRGEEVGKEVAAKIGTSILEFVSKIEQIQQERYKRAKTELRGDKRTENLDTGNGNLELGSVHRLADIGYEINKFDTEVASAYTSHVLEQYLQKFSDKSARPIQPKESHSLNLVFATLAETIAQGKEIPAKLKESLKAILPIIKAGGEGIVDSRRLETVKQHI